MGRIGGGRREEEIGSRRGEMREDFRIPWSSRFHDLAGEDVCIDYGQGIGWLGED